MNLKVLAAISVAIVLATLLVYQAFVAGFVVSNSTSGSVVQIDSENALLQLDPLEFSQISGNGGLSITLPAIGPGTADYAAFIYDPPSPPPPPPPPPSPPPSAKVVASYSAAYLFAVVEAEFNYSGNNNTMAYLGASLEHVMNNSPIQIIVLGTHGSSEQAITTFPNNAINIMPMGNGEVDINGEQFAVLSTYGLPSSVATAIGNTTVTIGSGGSNGEVIYILVLLPSYGVIGASAATFTAALNLYGYQA
ncbi:hypothetical protein DJ529_09350 [Sulfolobus sp. C3]|nr:hypothetical protein DJ529_09350 [Sulfolobus sp. C3]